MYLDDEPGFVGVFDVEDDAYEFQRRYAANFGRAVLLTPVTLPYRRSDYQSKVSLRERLPDDS